MYDMIVANAHKPTGNYKIAAAAYKEYRKEELIAALDAAESAKTRQQFAVCPLVKKITLRFAKPIFRFTWTRAVQSH